MKAFHEWVKVEDVSEALPTFCTSDIGHFFIVGEWGATSVDSALSRFQYGGEEGAEGGPYLPGMGWPGEVLSEDGRNTSPRGSFHKN